MLVDDTIHLSEDILNNRPWKYSEVKWNLDKLIKEVKSISSNVLEVTVHYSVCNLLSALHLTSRYNQKLHDIYRNLPITNIIELFWLFPTICQVYQGFKNQMRQDSSYFETTVIFSTKINRFHLTKIGLYHIIK